MAEPASPLLRYADRHEAEAIGSMADGTSSSEFHISHGSMIRLLRASGFEVIDLIELYPEPGSPTSYEFVDADWASKWPPEEAWIARRIS